jgi:hypothetical protein
MDEPLAGVAEAAELLGVEPQRIARWRDRGVVLPGGRRVRFPEPVQVLRATPIWRVGEIERLRDALNAPAPPVEHL